MRKLLLTALGMLMSLPAISRDFEYTYKGQTLTYTVLDEDAKTCSTKAGDYYTGSGNDVSGELIIPEIAKDNDMEYTVKAIGDESFYECNLTSLTIPNTIESIGREAFYHVPISSLVIPNSVRHIGHAAFNLCTKLESVTINDSGNNSNNPLLTIGKYAFCDCDKLVTATIGNSVKTIDEWAFSDCKRLISLDLGNSVQVIGNQAFENCKGLTTVTIPNSVETFGDNVFHNCTSLESVTMGCSTIGKRAFKDCTNLTTVDFGNSLQTIGDEAFSGCINLEPFTFPESLEVIGGSAFSGCINLSSVTFPDRLKSIGNNAFKDCISLTSVVIPNSVEYLGGFYGCKNLSSVTLGGAIREIGVDAFCNCTKLREAIVPPLVEKIGGGAFGTDWYTESFIQKAIMGPNVKSIGYCPFGDWAPEYYITTQTPPDIPFRALGYVDVATLYLQGSSAVYAYKSYDKYWELGRDEPPVYDWDDFRSYIEMTLPMDMEINAEEIEGNAGDTFQLTAKLIPEDVTLPYIFWRSTNPDVATVDHNGLVTIHRGPADVAADESGEYKPFSCNIIAESLYYEGPAPEVLVNGGESAIGSITDDSENSNDNNANGEIDFNAPAEVYNLQGMLICHDARNLPAGLYIIRQGKNVKKLRI